MTGGQNPKDQLAAMRAGVDQATETLNEFNKMFGSMYQTLKAEGVPDNIVAMVMQRYLDLLIPPANPLAGLLPQFPQEEE